MGHNPLLSSDWIRKTVQILRSYEHWTADPLIGNLAEGAEEQARQLFEYEGVVLAHGTEPDPIFYYGNLTALRLWEIRLDQLLKMPSRESAEPNERTSRGKMLSQGEDHGCIRDYEGIRISKTGRRFYVRNATIWNVLDECGARIGQAATFREWEFIDQNNRG